MTEPSTTAVAARDEDGPLSVALSLKQEIDEFIATGDRQALVQGLRDQFLSNRHIAASETEKARIHATSILVSRMENMSDSMLLRAIEMLARTSDKDMEALFGISPGGGRQGPQFNFVTQNNQAPGGIPSTPSEPGGPNPIRQTGQVLEAIEHLSKFFSNKPKDAPLIEGRSREADDVEVER